MKNDATKSKKNLQSSINERTHTHASTRANSGFRRVLTNIRIQILLVDAALAESDHHCLGVVTVKLLSAYGANFSVQDEDKNTAMHLAAEAGHWDTCTFVAQRGMTLTIRYANCWRIFCKKVIVFNACV